MGDTTANTLRAMSEVKERLAVLRGGVRKRLDLPAEDKPAGESLGGGWDQYPEVK